MATDGKVTFWDATSGAPTYNAQELRQLDSPILMPGPASSPFSGRSGRQVNNSGLAVTVTPTGNGSVSVSAGAGVIYDNAYAINGAWRFALPTAKTGIALAARPGAGTTRYDLVVARIYDSGIGVGAVKELKIEVVTGTASATPSAPALPALSMLLSTLGPITSTSGAAIPKVDSSAVTVAAGGVLPVATDTERDALEAAGIAYPGLAVFNIQRGRIEMFVSAGVWDYPGRPQAYTPSVTGVPTSGNVGRFTRIGKLITVEFKLGVTGAATADIVMSLPSTPQTGAGTPQASGLVAGSALGNRGGAVQAAFPYIYSAGAVFISTATGTNFGAAVPGAWASGQSISGTLSYEEA
jgi:hypothetical protein